MIKKNKQLMCLLVIGVLSFLLCQQSFAAETAYKTYTLSSEGIVETQTAYEAYEIIQNKEFQKIEDMYLDENKFYVADSQAQAILIINKEGELLKKITNPELEKPMGVALDKEKNIYVTDPIQEAVFCFNQDGQLIKKYEKPTEPLFGKNAPFKPVKVVLDIRGNLYVIGEGSVNGIIQLNKEGEFLGYFGANLTEQSAFARLKNSILSELQLEKMIQAVPVAPSNVTIDEKGIVYSVTAQNKNGVSSVSKLNIAGSNMLPSTMYTLENNASLTVGNYNNFYVLTSTGQIAEYDSHGNLLFLFGTEQSEEQRLGLYRSPTSIVVDPQDNLYIADSENQVIQKLKTTELADTVHEGIKYLEDGKYLEGKKFWEEVLHLNSSFYSAYIGVGEASLKEEKYSDALEYFRIGDIKIGYSNAFWEIRQEWLNRYLSNILVAIILFFIVLYLLKRINKKTEFWSKKKKVWTNWKNTRNLEGFFLFFQMFRHPIDTFYALKKEKKISILTGSIFYVIAFFEFIYFQYGVGYLFNLHLHKSIGIILLSIIFISLIGLFVLMNYLMASITEGEGRLSEIYIGTIYSAAPLIMMIIPIVLVSNVLTLNEGFVYSFSLLTALVWTGVNLVLMIKELHNFSMIEVIKNILLTLFGIIIFVSVAYIIFILMNQVLDFCIQIIQEVSSLVKLS